MPILFVKIHDLSCLFMIIQISSSSSSFFGATAPPSSFLCNFVHSTCSQCALLVVHSPSIGICTIGSVLSRINIWFPDVRSAESSFGSNKRERQKCSFYYFAQIHCLAHKEKKNYPNYNNIENIRASI